jgi:hypothetical protein
VTAGLNASVVQLHWVQGGVNQTVSVASPFDYLYFQAPLYTSFYRVP